MSTTNPVSGPATGPVASSNNIPSNMQITQTGFLKIITAQLQEQNPLSPADPTQFVTQLEGMSQVSAMQSMQTSLSASQVMGGTSMLGRSVLAPGSAANLTAGGSISGAIAAPAGTSQLTVSITDSTGATVASFNVPPQVSGLTNFGWNGKTSAGANAPAGLYGVKVSAAVNGKSQSVTPLVVSKVSSVTIDPNNQGVDLNTDSGTVTLNSVVSVM